MVWTFTPGEILTAANLNAALDELRSATVVVEFTPGSSLDATGASMTDWISMGNITVPTWCTTVFVQMNIVGWYAITAVATQCTLRTTVGATAGSTLGRADGYVVSERLNTSWVDSIASPPTGSQALKVQALRVTGTGAIRADTSSTATALIIYK